MKYLLFLVSFFAVVFKPFAQSSQHQQRFDSTFYHIYQVTASIAIERALVAADSLYRASTDDVQKIRSLMLISDIYHRMANRDSSIYHAEQAAKIAEKTANYVWQARIFGVLSTQHRETGLLNQGRHYLKKGLAVSQKITRVDVANQFKGHVYQERGFYSMAEDEVNDAIVNFKQAASYFNQLPESANKFFFQAQNDERLGACYFQLQFIDSAVYHFSRALTTLETNAPDNETPVKGFIYNGLGNVKLAQNDPEGAFDYLQQALEVAEATQFPNLKMTVYRSLAQYYEATGDLEAYARYNEMYLGTIKSNVSQNRSYADNIVTNTQTRLDKLAISVKNMLWVIALIVLITLLARSSPGKPAYGGNRTGILKQQMK